MTEGGARHGKNAPFAGSNAAVKTTLFMLVSRRT